MTTNSENLSKLPWRPIAGIGLAALASWLILKNHLLPISSFAVVSNEAATMRAPIAGKVSHDVRVGSRLRQGGELGRVENALVDTTLLVTLEDELNRLDGQVAATDNAVAALSRQAQTLSNRTAHYSKTQQKYLEQQLTAASAASSSLAVTADVRKSAHERAAAMSEVGIVSQTRVDDLRAEEADASASQEQARMREEILRMQLSALKNGVLSVSDFAADKPYSQQRRDEVELRLIDVTRDLAAARARSKPLEQWRDREQRRIAALRNTKLAAPVNGVVNRVFASPEEYVHQGRELFQVLDCDKPIVVALVSERVFSKLNLDDRAYVRLSGTVRTFEARVTALLGISDDGPPEVLRAAGVPDASVVKDRHRVILSAPGAGCLFAKPAEVYFR